MELALILLLSFYVVGISGREHVKGCELKFLKIPKCGGMVVSLKESGSGIILCFLPCMFIGKEGMGVIKCLG